MNAPSVDALTEFTVEASGFKAETGHASGGTLSFVSKSGTNQIHGSAFEFLRNQDLVARSFFATQRSVYKQNNFGATVGGPVWIPKLYNGKNKTFFFVSYEGFRNRVGASNGTYYSVPTPEMWNGDFSKWVDGSGKLYPIYDPTSPTVVNGVYQRTAFANNVIPSSLFDPVAAKFASYVKTLIAPNRTDIVMTPGTSAYVRQNYVSSGTSIAPSDKYSFKIDQSLGSKHHISYFQNHYRDAEAFGPAGAPGMPLPIGGDQGYNQSTVYRANWDYTIAPTLLNRFYGGFNNWREDHGAPSISTDTSMSQGMTGLEPAGYWKQKGLCIPNYPECTIFPIIGTGDFTGWGGNGPNGSDRLVFEMHDDMTKTKGAHTFKWGFYYGNSHYDGFGLQNAAGSLGFSYKNTAAPLAASQAAGGGSGLASLLLGQVNNYSLDTPRYLSTWYRTNQAYIQDDWKVSRKLMLNLGFRYEMNQAPISGDDRLSDLSFSTPNPAAGGRLGAIIFAGTGTGRTGSRKLIPNWYGGLGPRLSFAYALNDKTTIRGAATRSFGPLTGIGQSSHNLGFAVRTVNADPNNGLTPYWILQQGAPAYFTPPLIDPSVGIGTNPPAYHDKHANIPDSELNYSFSIQRQLTATSSVEVDYLAALASDITSNFLAVNQVPYNSLPAALSPFTTSGRTVLSSLITSSTAINAGVAMPWTCAPGDARCIPFTSVPGLSPSVQQAMRPYPQYTTINTLDGGGDRIGHSTYHSMTVKYDKRYGSGLTVQLSYKLSKMLTDTDATSSIPGDMYNLRLLKSIASFDQTHNVKFTYAYDLPVGKGKALLSNGGVASAILGGWRISGIQTYASGTPMSLGTPITFPIGDFSNRAQITTYDGWRGAVSGSRFDPNVNLYLQPQSFFPTQTINSFGNATRYNPKMRYWPGFNENISVTREFSLKEKAHLEFRLEGFNVLNRVAFGPLGGATTLTNANWGKWGAQSNSPRRMQLVAN
jgi:hypothetical protein